MATLVTVKVRPETKEKIEGYREYRRETYDDILSRVLDEYGRLVKRCEELEAELEDCEEELEELADECEE